MATYRLISRHLSNLPDTAYATEREARKAAKRVVEQHRYIVRVVMDVAECGPMPTVAEWKEASDG